MPDFRPQFSIVLPVHNGAKYIRATMQYIFQQTYPHFKVLILENCSEDDTLSIVQSFSDDRVQILPASTPLSIEENWKRITDLPLSEWMTIVSHDDLLYPTFLNGMVDLIEAEPEASLYSSHFDIIDPQGAFVRRCRPIPAVETGEDFLHARQHYDRDSFGTGYVTRSRDYRQVGGFPALPRLYYADDLAVYKLTQLSKKVCSPEVLFAYRYHRHSASYTVELETLYEASRMYLLTLAEADYMKTPENAILARQYVEKTFNRRYHRFLVDLILANDNTQIAAYRKTKQQLFEWTTRDQLFSVYDLASRITEMLLNLPVPKISALIARLIEGFAVITRHIRKL